MPVCPPVLPPALPCALVSVDGHVGARCHSLYSRDIREGDADTCNVWVGSAAPAMAHQVNVHRPASHTPLAASQHPWLVTAPSPHRQCRRKGKPEEQRCRFCAAKLPPLCGLVDEQAIHKQELQERQRAQPSHASHAVYGLGEGVHEPGGSSCAEEPVHSRSWRLGSAVLVAVLEVGLLAMIAGTVVGFVLSGRNG